MVEIVSWSKRTFTDRSIMSHMAKSENHVSTRIRTLSHELFMISMRNSVCHSGVIIIFRLNTFGKYIGRKISIIHGDFWLFLDKFSRLFQQFFFLTVHHLRCLIHNNWLYHLSEFPYKVRCVRIEKHYCPEYENSAKSSPPKSSFSLSLLNSGYFIYIIKFLIIGKKIILHFLQRLEELTQQELVSMSE